MIDDAPAFITSSGLIYTAAPTLIESGLYTVTLTASLVVNGSVTKTQTSAFTVTVTSCVVTTFTAATTSQPSDYTTDDA